MRQYLILLFSVVFFASNAQEIFDYEKEISNIENYLQKEVTFKNELENISLSGTLLEPKDDNIKKVVIIVPGSGLDTRNSHYLLTEHLLKNNIAVFRYDERGVNKSEGNNSNVNYGITQMTNDLIAAVEEISSNYGSSNVKVGLIGHSEGGLSTINVVKTNSNIDFLIQWATPVQKHGEFLKYQIKTGVNTFDRELIFDSNQRKIEIINIVQDVISKNPEMEDLKLSKELKKATSEYGYTRKNYERFTFWSFPTRKDLLRQNNEATYRDLNIPMLYIIGSEDIFVDPNANTLFLKGLNNSNIETIIFSGLNHYLTKERILPNKIKMSVSFYEIDQIALDKIVNWILEK